MINIIKKSSFTGHNGAVFGLDWGASPNILYSAGGDGWVVQWDTESPDLGKLIAKAETSLFCLKYLPITNCIVAGTMYGGVHWIYPEYPEKNSNELHHSKGVFAFCLDNQNLFSVGGDGMLTKWDIHISKPVESLRLSSKSLRSVRLMPDNNTLLIGCSDSNIYLVDSTEMKLIKTILAAHHPSVFVAESLNEDTIISGGRDAKLKIWSVNNFENNKLEIAAHMNAVNNIALHPKEPIIATCSRDKTIKIWTKDLELLKVLEGVRDEGHFNSVNNILWSVDNNYLISASDDRNIILWQIDFIN